MRWRLLLATLLALAPVHAIRAQDDAEPDSSAAPPTASTPAANREEADEERSRDAEIRFEPSEQISEDLSVSFPADI